MPAPHVCDDFVDEVDTNPTSANRFLVALLTKAGRVLLQQLTLWACRRALPCVELISAEVD